MGLRLPNRVNTSQLRLPSPRRRNNIPSPSNFPLPPSGFLLPPSRPIRVNSATGFPLPPAGVPSLSQTRSRVRNTPLTPRTPRVIDSNSNDDYVEFILGGEESPVMIQRPNLRNQQQRLNQRIDYWRRAFARNTPATTPQAVVATPNVAVTNTIQSPGITPMFPTVPPVTTTRPSTVVYSANLSDPQPLPKTPDPTGGRRRRLTKRRKHKKNSRRYR